MASGLLPSVPGYQALVITLGMLGATVMPHNLYLHSSLVQTRRIGTDVASRREAIRFNTLDSAIALNLAFFVNAAILVMAAAVFYRAGYHEVAGLQDAHQLLAGLVGSSIAPIAFAVALLAAGQSSTITGTLAGQIVMEGFLAVRIPPWLRRLVTRLAAIVPAVITISIYGERGTVTLLVISQVVLSMQLPFAAIPLLQFVSDRRRMGELAIGPVLRTLGWLAVTAIVSLNVWLVFDTLGKWREELGPDAGWFTLAVTPVLLGAGLLLAYVVAKPLMRRLSRPRRAATGAGRASRPGAAAARRGGPPAGAGWPSRSTSRGASGRSCGPPCSWWGPAARAWRSCTWWRAPRAAWPATRRPTPRCWPTPPGWRRWRRSCAGSASRWNASWGPGSGCPSLHAW